MSELPAGYWKEQEKEQARRKELTDSSRRLFSDGITRVLEIGCGHGHYLSDYASAHPEEHCIGIDLLNRRVEKADRKKEKRELSKLQFLKAEAVEFLETLPERNLHRDGPGGVGLQCDHGQVE